MFYLGESAVWRHSPADTKRDFYALVQGLEGAGARSFIDMALQTDKDTGNSPLTKHCLRSNWPSSRMIWLACSPIRAYSDAQVKFQTASINTKVEHTILR